MKLGLSSYSLEKAIAGGEMTFLEAVRWVADHGGEHIEIVPIGMDLTKDTALADSIRSAAADAGIEISGYAIGADFMKDPDGFELEIERVKREVDAAARLGVKLMRHDAAWGADTSIRRFNAELGRMAEACARIADYAADFGITTSVENHGYYVQGSDRIQALIHAVDRPNFRTTMDVGNFMCADEDSVAAVKKNIPYASMIHIKDFYLRPGTRAYGEGWFRTASGNYLRGAIAGHGDIDMPEVLRVIKASGYDGHLSLEFEGMEDCRLASRLGLENVRRMWDEA